MNAGTQVRRPTLGQVIDYYTSSDFLSFLLNMCRTRRVALIIPERLHWEPNWGENEIQAADLDRLGQHVLDKIAQHLPGVSLDDRPSYYPSFHQSVGRWPDGGGRTTFKRGQRLQAQERDLIFEADLPTWRESFQDIGSILDLMDRYDVPYLHRFSGHRSLHVVIPAAALPIRYHGGGSRKLVLRLIRWSGSQAHPLPQIARMPYSLNEDTGLVCLPIERGALPSFRPWQANVHLAEIRDTWEGSLTDQDRVRTDVFLDALKTLEQTGEEARGHLKGRAFYVPDRLKIASEYRERLGPLRGPEAAGSAWGLLVSDRALSEQVLLEGLECTDADARWLTVEAFFLHGAGLSRAGFTKLLEQDEEYVRPAAVDVLLRFEEDVVPHLIRMIGDLEHHPQAGVTAAHLLTQSDSLREKVLQGIVQHVDRSRDALIAAACLTGSVTGNWSEAFGLLRPVRTATDLSRRERVGLAALELMSTMGRGNKWEEGKKSQELAALGREVTDLLLIAAASPHRRFRRGIVGALALLADPRAMNLLIRALADDYSKVRRKAVTGLIRIGAAAVDPLIEATASDQVLVRRYAVHCLGCIGALRAKRFILQALDDGDETVRRQAIRALKNLATADDVERLKQVLREEPFEGAMEALQAIAAAGPTGTQAMREMALEERNPGAAYYLAGQGEPRGREILAERLVADDGKREDATEFLRELRDARCVPFFAAQLKTTTHWRGAFVAHELGRIGTPEAVAALIAALSREYVQVRRGALRGLAEAKDPIAIEPLIRCLNEDEDPKARGLAADALVEIGKEAVKPLRRALEEGRMRDRQRRSLVVGALRKLGVEAV